MERLKYISSERMFEGVIAEVHDGAVTIDLKGRLGRLMIPNRMLISQTPPEIGQEVGFMMSYPEVLNPEPNEDYRDILLKEKIMQEKRKEKTLSILEKQIQTKNKELEELLELIEKKKLDAK